jgi:hypothetical protein
MQSIIVSRVNQYTLGFSIFQYLQIGEQLSCNNILRRLTDEVQNIYGPHDALNRFFAKCHYPGVEVLAAVSRVKRFLESFADWKDTHYTKNGFLNEYNIQRGFYHKNVCIGECLSSYQNSEEALRRLTSNLMNSFNRVFATNDTFIEFFEHWLGEPVKILTSLSFLLLENYVDNSTEASRPYWPVRPFPASDSVSNYLRKLNIDQNT